MDPLEAYLEKVRTRAYTITDADVQAVKDAGVSEDEIFERTVAVAVERDDAGSQPPKRVHRMRLEILNGDHAPPEALGVIKTLLYRPDVFGGWFSDELDGVMRGPSEWSAGERELFAGFASHLNQCLF